MSRHVARGRSMFPLGASLLLVALGTAAENQPTPAAQSAAGKVAPGAAASVQLRRATGVVLLPIGGWPAAGGDQQGSCTSANCVSAACRAVSVRVVRANAAGMATHLVATAEVHPTPVSAGDWKRGCRFTIGGLEDGVAYRIVAALPYEAWMPPQPPGSEFGFKGFCPSQSGTFTPTAAKPLFTCPNIQLIRMP